VIVKIRNFALVKKPFQILTLLLAMLVFLSPVLSFASVLTVEEHASEMDMSCCATDDSAGSEHDCCHSESSKNEKKNCGDTGCPTNDCHLHTVTSFHIYFPEILSEKETEIVSLEKLKFDNYSSLTIKDLNYSFWNPPKYIS